MGVKFLGTFQWGIWGRARGWGGGEIPPYFGLKKNRRRKRSWQDKKRLPFPLPPNLLLSLRSVSTTAINRA